MWSNLPADLVRLCVPPPAAAVCRTWREALRGSTASTTRLLSYDTWTRSCPFWKWTAVRLRDSLSAPDLQKVQLEDCLLLTTLNLENLPHLRNLQFHRCKNLRSVQVHLPQLEDFVAGSCTSLEIVSFWSPQLRRLSLQFCCALDEVWGLGPTLTELQIVACPQLDTTLGVDDLTSLRKLELRHVANLAYLSSLPSSLHTLELSHTALKRINVLESCPDLQNLQLQWCMSLDWIQPLTLCSTLVVLDVSYTSLVQLAQLPSSLRKLVAKFCSRLSSIDTTACRELQTVELVSCPHLVDFWPIVQVSPALRHLTVGHLGWPPAQQSLRALFSACPELEELHVHGSTRLVADGGDASQLVHLDLAGCTLWDLKLPTAPKLSLLDLSHQDHIVALHTCFRQLACLRAVGCPFLEVVQGFWNVLETDMCPRLVKVVRLSEI